MMNTCRAVRWGRPIAAIAVTLAFLFITLSDSVGGIQGSGFTRRAVVVGQITRFGSMVVNGAEYDTSAASVQIDGEPATESGLRLGQVVTVRAKVNERGTAGAATEISFSSDVLGAVAQVDVAGGTLVVLGQKILVPGDTLFDERIPGGDISGLEPGVRIQVSGFPNAAGELVATRIDLAPDGSSNSRLKGVVQALDATAGTFRINELTVNYGDAPIPATLANGNTAFVSGSVLDGQSLLHATDVEVISGLGGTAGERGVVAGLITVFDSSSDFTLAAQRILTDDRTHFVLHGQTLGPSLPVEVKGVFNADGVLVATHVKAKAKSGSKSNRD
jgi:hypothetical protein